jgi:hypothetical protein
VNFSCDFPFKDTRIWTKKAFRYNIFNNFSGEDHRSNLKIINYRWIDPLKAICSSLACVRPRNFFHSSNAETLHISASIPDKSFSSQFFFQILQIFQAVWDGTHSPHPHPPPHTARANLSYLYSNSFAIHNFPILIVLKQWRLKVPECKISDLVFTLTILYLGIGVSGTGKKIVCF